MVRAANKAQAIRFACHKIVSIDLLTTEDAIKLAKEGQELLDATAEDEPAEEQAEQPPASDTPPTDDPPEDVRKQKAREAEERKEEA